MDRIQTTVLSCSPGSAKVLIMRDKSSVTVCRCHSWASGEGALLDYLICPEEYRWRGGSSTSTSPTWTTGRRHLPTLHRWRIDLTSGRVGEHQLDDRAIEFPRCDERRVGLPHRYGYAVHTLEAL